MHYHFFTTFAISMLKRSIAIFLLMLASTVWLTHAILPHHHHNSQACLQAEYGQHNKDYHAHTPESNSHNHDHNTTSNCVLYQLAIVPQPILKGNGGVTEPPQFDTDYGFFQAVVAYTHSVVFISPKPHTLYINSVSTSLCLAFIGQSLGLRAPPAV